MTTALVTRTLVVCGSKTAAHVERLLTERVGANLYEVWNVISSTGERWWVLTPPTNLYAQADLGSASVALSFHIGLMARVMNQYEVPVAPRSEAMLPESWRRWEDAVDALHHAREAEDFQAVGMRLRECLVALAGEVASDELEPAGEEWPQAATSRGGATCWLTFLRAGAAASVCGRTSRRWRKRRGLTSTGSPTPVTQPRSTLRSAPRRSAPARNLHRCSAAVGVVGPAESLRAVRLLCPDRGDLSQVRLDRRGVRSAGGEAAPRPGDVEGTPCETTSVVDTQVGPEDYRRRR